MGKKYDTSLRKGKILFASSLILNFLMFIALFYQWGKPCAYTTLSTTDFITSSTSSSTSSSKSDLQEQEDPLAPLNANPQDSSPSSSPQSSASSSSSSSSSSSESSPSSSSISSSSSSSSNAIKPLVAAPPMDVSIPDDLSSSTSFDVSQHTITWNYCPLQQDDVLPKPFPFCEETPNSEQGWQLGWYGAHVLVHSTGPQRTLPPYEACVHLPPPGYVFPSKYLPLPATGPGVHWPNLRVKTIEDLKIFNKATPKNLYHFDAPVYDLDALEELRLGAKYIPFGVKIRLMLDIGAGGGSLGLLLKRKYDVQVLSTIFPDWPYCEYISERGGLCMLVDVMEAMPFAKFTFDVIHVSWVYHGQQPEEITVMFMEINRILRPGGYLWMRGGYSQRQITALEGLASRLGWKTLYDKQVEKPPGIQDISFGPNLKYNKDWWVIWLKPVATNARNDCPPAQPALETRR